ncbi:MAG TPA: hypothetical protein VK983_04660 [Candidatus Limnocylindrales bacterium]|nr:hypothetical protein [Candidatus Limnocylindrales bacterium]
MLVAGLRPDLVIGISEDSSRYARDVARARGVHCLPLVESETGEPYFKGLGQTLVPFYGRIALVGSVVSDRLDVLGVLKLPGVGERAVGLVSIWDQGQEGDRAVLPEYLEQRAVVQECLPHRINNEGSAARVPTA